VIDLRRGDCLKIAPTLSSIDAVVSDPPWGIQADIDYTRFSGGASGKPNRGRNYGPGIRGDATTFDPSPWIGYPKVALWGGHCFAGQLPVGNWLVWLKKPDQQFGTFLSDAELCWVKRRPYVRKRAPGVYAFRHVWSGFQRESEKGQTLHPTQKPVALMRWVIERMKLAPGATILDPYMGAGATGVAAVELGFNFIGIEIDRAYFQVARRRIQAAQQATEKRAS
jgi:site-specific DNA-methyltransferase (adenine-specific)